jgi:putative endonuclease
VVLPAPPTVVGGGGLVRATDAVGQYGEKLAGRHLEAAGFTVLERRWRCSQGEIDVVAVDGRCLVICEVKTRRSVHAGGPAEAVTPAKLARLRRLAAVWLAQQEVSWAEIRIDVVTVLLPRAGSAQIEHLRGVS